MFHIDDNDLFTELGQFIKTIDEKKIVQNAQSENNAIPTAPIGSSKELSSTQERSSKKRKMNADTLFDEKKKKIEEDLDLIFLHNQEPIPPNSTWKIKDGVKHIGDSPILFRMQYEQIKNAKFYHSRTCERAPTPSYYDQLAKRKFTSEDGAPLITESALCKRKFNFTGTETQLTRDQKCHLRYKNEHLWWCELPVSCSCRNVRPEKPLQEVLKSDAGTRVKILENENENEPQTTIRLSSFYSAPYQAVGLFGKKPNFTQSTEKQDEQNGSVMRRMGNNPSDNGYS